MPQPSNTILHLLRQLWGHLSKRRRMQYVVLLGLMVVTSFAEIFSLGAVLPFLGVLTSPEVFFRHPLLQPFISFFGIGAPQGLLLPLTVVFGVAALLAGAMRLLQIWANMRVSFATGADVSVALYERTLYQPYAVHVARNSSAIIDAVASKVNRVIFGGIIPAINIITSTVILLSILTTLLVIDTLVALVAFGSFGVTYAFIITITRKRLRLNSQVIARESNNTVKALQEGLGGIRDVLLDGNQPLYCATYRNAVLPLRRAEGYNQFISQSPRFGVEAIGMLLIAALAYGLAEQPGGVARAIPILGTLALGAQRMLPALQQLYAAWSGLQGNAASLKDVVELLNQPLPDKELLACSCVLPFHHALVLRNLSFRYTPDAQEVLQGVNLTIPKGSRVGFIGVTGSGKSTLLDIIMGLLQPTAGRLEVDGVALTTANQRAWQCHIAHVPQAIFLADSSIEENIAFGVSKEQINHERVKQAAKQAQIAEYIEALPKKYKTFVGERGVRLSGGQRQRIGIARALYKQADVIIFDEATSALDNETEHAVMQAIEQLGSDITILIIAHRLTTLKDCDMVVELEGGVVKMIGSYQEILVNK